MHIPYYNRYADKTQVFSLYKNDDISRRSQHVQLVARIARNIGRVLNLNQDLIEAIALAHDIGHTPLGHAGEAMLNEISLKYLGEYFAHNDEFSKAGEMLDKVRYARGISTTNLASSIGSLEVFHTQLIKEMRREFVGEGQMFFQYKRLDQKPKDNIVFVFDKPNNEDV